MAMVNAVY